MCFFIVPKQLNSNSIVYSFGVGEDISFDEEVIHEFGCPVYAYDPTPKSKIFVEQNKKMPIEVDVKKLSTLMQENSHTHIDLLKMDIEGSEYAVLDNILKEKIDIKQICVEVHHRFEGIGIAKQKN